MILHLKKHRKVFIPLIAILFFSTLYLALGRHKTLKEKPAQVVKSLTAIAKDVPIYIEALGNVIPLDTVTIKTQIDGLLMKIYFKEGELVKKGDVLVQIDERPLLAQRMEYEGQLKRDEALLANARIDLKRYQTLWKQDSISEQTLATQVALVKEYEGAVELDRGLIAVTNVNLNYCRIVAPVDGRVGLRQVDAGNYVQTTDPSGIVVLTSLNPMSVIFSIAEDDIQRILPDALANKPIEVQALNRLGMKQLATGRLSALDNEVNVSTGSVKLRAIFDNKSNTLFPNQFVNIKMRVMLYKQAVVIPTAAINHGSNNDFVYLIQPDFTAKTQTIKTGPTVGDETLVLKGLTAGQKVVIDGNDKLNDGDRVKVA